MGALVDCSVKSGYLLDSGLLNTDVSHYSMHIVRMSASISLKLHVRWRRCDTLCTSGFMDDVTFAHNGQE